MSVAWNLLRSKLPKGEFGRNVLVLFGGTTLAQAITILSAPILTRLYTPAVFGAYALFLAISTILASLASAKYEMAIILPEKDEDGFSLLALSCGIVVIVSLLTLGVTVFFKAEIIRLLANPEMSTWIYAIPLMVLLAGIYNALHYWNNRRKNYRRLSLNRVARSALTVGANIGMATSGVQNGLIAGGIAGQAFATSMFAVQIWKEDRRLAWTMTRLMIKQQAVRYVDFPKYLIPSGLVESVSGQLPLILLSSFFGATTLGLFSLALRTVGLPMSLIAESIRDVFRQSASADYVELGNCEAIFARTFRRLLLLAILPCVVLLLFSPFLFQFVFGTQWRVAGEYTQIMAVMFFLRFISSPLSSMFYIAEKQKWDLAIQVVLFLVILGSLIGVYRLNQPPKVAIAIYSVVYSVKYLIEFYLSYRFSQNRGGAATKTVPKTVDEMIGQEISEL